jgi:KaiC/GvpD/RAD55 family RecA-like ATPase
MAAIVFDIDEVKPTPPPAPKVDILDLLRKKSPLMLPRQPIEYLVDGLIVKGQFTVVSGKGSSGKSSIILHWCKDHFIPAGCDVLYLDRDNCLSTVQDVLSRIVGPHLPDNFFYWGDWLTDENGNDVPVEGMGETLVELVKQMKSPVLIFDTLRKFSRCDENDNTQMGNFVNDMKQLTKRYGATVILVHHDNKEGSGYRGASSLRDDVDTLLQVESIKNPDTFRIETLTIRPDKGKVLLRSMTYSFDDWGKPVVHQEVLDSRLMDIIRRNPGITQDSLEQEAMRQGITTREKIREFLVKQMAGHKIERKNLPGRRVKGKAVSGLHVRDEVPTVLEGVE